MWTRFLLGVEARERGLSSRSGRAFRCPFRGPLWPAFGRAALEKGFDARICLLDRARKLVQSFCLSCDFAGVEIDHQFVAQAGAAANALDNEQGVHFFFVAGLQLALAKFLHSGSSQAYVVHGIAKLIEQSQLNSAGAERIFQFLQFYAGFLGQESDSPKCSLGIVNSTMMPSATPLREDGVASTRASAVSADSRLTSVTRDPTSG